MEIKNNELHLSEPEQAISGLESPVAVDANAAYRFALAQSTVDTLVKTLATTADLDPNTRQKFQRDIEVNRSRAEIFQEAAGAYSLILMGTRG